MPEFTPAPKPNNGNNINYGLGACAAERFWTPSNTIGSGNE